MIKVLIIDDEENAREIILEYLENYHDVEVAGEFADGFTALKAINELKPDLIFLDIQMPKLTGFEMLELMEDPPLVVFATAYDDFAIKAFELNAIDYLLKPFSLERFQETMSKAKARLNEKGSKSGIDDLMVHLDNKSETLNRIVVKTRSDIKIIAVEKIIYFEAQDDYVMIHLADAKFLKKKTMSFYEKNLPANTFVRVHRSYIVKIDQIKRIEPYEKSSQVLILNDDRKIPLSRQGLSNLKKIMDI
ncbi:MAG: LytTR family transcriptional regulator DNA-binding domain-containing protein [Bacteroidales bacterium]|nr:LytTR family transcriptional regulator DNA-binding domain-containing protein [Bacteroidales bacterium]MCF8391654.1 LytTR family transcriptional regulator DNA-binding domain-containing protein [Bacteroidales bacterium]